MEIRSRQPTFRAPSREVHGRRDDKARTGRHPMRAWTADELARIGDADELRIASRRPDGSLRPFVIIWVVRVGDDLYVRSAHGSDNPWFLRAAASGTGRIRAGGLERDVTFEPPGAGIDANLDAAYHAKYDHYGPPLVGPVVSAESARATLRLVPA